MKDIEVFLKKNKKKSNNIVLKDTKIYQTMKNKSLLNTEKNIIKWEKTPYYNYKKLFSFRKSKTILKSHDLESSFDEE